MSRSRTFPPWALLRRLLRVQLRLKVMVGVMVVTLIALVAFDIGAVTTMRRYLLNQTDNDLQLTLALTVPRLDAILSGGTLVGPNAKVSGGPRQFGPLPGTKFPSLPGAFDIALLPTRGKQVTLQTNVGGGAGVTRWVLSPKIARVVSQAGPHTLVVNGAKGKALLRAQSVHVRGGLLVDGTSLEQVTKTIDQVEVIVTVGSLAVVLLIGFGVFFMLRRGLRPIETMARQADRITGGDLTDRVAPQHPRSEVGRLGAALNGMLTRIEADVHEREASQQQMRRFFADASHELRTPLASLRANAELYQQGALRSSDEVDEVMDRIVLETRRMGRLVDDMLRLARLGQQPGQSQEPVDVTAVVTGCAERVQIADPARTWRVRAAGGLTTVGDDELLRRAVDNLLMNVLVHTPPGTAGTISASVAGDRVTIEVSDDGPGVPPDKLPHIFERFYRAGASSSRPGSGLGLAIAAEIASAHGGTAAAEPVSPHGLRITLTLLARQPSPLAELAVSAR
ncbi:MAG TPA: HAMP domain-containing sensor histidine kinase [Streptosporangiaceae bacterium]|jgi:two-component system OmpR family sensor kinase